jgi:hypothetical protein
MDYLNKVMKSVRIPAKLGQEDLTLYTSYALFALVAMYVFYNGQLATIGLAIGVAMIMYAVTNGKLAVSLIAGAFVALLAVHYSRSRMEGFETESGEAEETEEVAEEEGEESQEESVVDRPVEEEVAEEFQDLKKPKAAKKKRAPPNHGSRAEPFVLGKKYKIPSEDDDKEFHLDAGTTFLNAYKSLKPDQIAAMTKDTQDLMQTQKQLMSTLNTLKPLIKDGKDMMEMFQGYFGNGKSSLM